MKQVITILILVFIFLSSCGQVDNNEHSTELIEIKISFGGFVPGGGQYYLSYQNNNWSATFIDRTRKLKHQYKGTDGQLKSAFNILKENCIFDLPNQQDLKINGIIEDGTSYFVEYIVGKNSGSYTYENPDLYLEINKDVKELKLFCNIINTFRSLFPNK